MRRGALAAPRRAEPAAGAWRLEAEPEQAAELLGRSPALTRALLLAGCPLAWRLAPEPARAELQRIRGSL